MRISRIQLAGLAVAIAGGAAQEAVADDRTIDTSITTPVVTSNAANSSAGDITVTSAGAITIETGEAGITLDSDNDVTMNGGLLADEEDDVIGILIQDGFTGAVSIGGAINFTEDHSFADTDSDGDVDGTWADGENRIGVFLNGTFNGDIVTTSSAAMTIEGNNSAGIRIDGTLNGDLILDGSIAVRGDNSVGVLIQGAGTGVTGDVIQRGALSIRGGNAVGVLVDSAIGGELSLRGSYIVTGYPSTLALADQSDLDADDLLQSGAAVLVRESISGGVIVEGTGVENDDDDDDDGTDNEAGDDTTAQFLVYGSAPTIHVLADGTNIVLGPNAFGGFGFVNRGDVRSEGVFDGINSTALRFEGIGGSTVDTSGGITNERLLQAAAQDANTYGISIGDGVTVPLLRNRSNILSTVTSDSATDTAFGIFIEGGTVTSFENSGIIAAELFGEAGTTVAIIDTSNTLATITNSGTIAAQLIPTDDNLADGVTPTITGEAIAIDVSASSIGVTLNQIADVPFTDDDSTDDDVDSRPEVRILGDVRFGSGADTFNLLDGRVEGDLSFGGGLDTFLIDNGAIYSGILSDSGGGLNITVNDGLLDLHGAVGGVVNITNATFSGDSEMRISLDETPVDSTLIQATGTVTFLPGAVITPFIPAGLPDSGTIVFLTANSLVGGANVVNPALSGDNVPFIYNLAVELVNPMAADGAANGLQAEFGLKSAAQLGLNNNQGLAFNPIIAALRLDAAASAAFLGLDNQAEFDDAYDDLMPSFSSAAAELAATAIQQAQGASGNRLAAVRLQGLNEVSVWAQEIGYFLTRTPATLEGQEFSGYGFGMAIGIDGPLDNGGLFGLSASFITSEVEEEGRPDGEISSTFGQVGAYLGTAAGIVDLDFVVGLGVGQMNSQRFVQIGEDYEAITEAEWWAYEGHGMARASIPMSLSDNWVITPSAALTYVVLVEDGYTEEGGGPAIDYDVDGVTSQRLWGDVGIELAGRFRLRGQTVIAPRLFAGYRANIIDEEAERTFRFVSTDDEFTLADEGFGDGGALVGIGIDATNGYSTFTLGYEGEFGDQIERHSINASIRFRF